MRRVQISKEGARDYTRIHTLVPCRPARSSYSLPIMLDIGSVFVRFIEDLARVISTHIDILKSPFKMMFIKYYSFKSVLKLYQQG